MLTPFCCGSLAYVGLRSKIRAQFKIQVKFVYLRIFSYFIENRFIFTGRYLDRHFNFNVVR
jgi:hypothetical protein